MKTKPQNPYSRLVKEARQFAFDVKYRRRKTMWTYPKTTEAKAWRLDDLYQRIAAADQLGWDVQLTTDSDGGVVVQYVKRAPEAPYPFRPD
jgi:hypothetical protein